MDLTQLQSISGLNYKIIEILIVYQELAIFLFSFFFAESVIFTASFLSAQGFWPPLTVFLFGLLGTVLSDLFWYFGGMYFLKITHQWDLFQGAYNKASAFVDKITKHRPFLMLLFIKFLYGTRFLLLIYISMKGLKLKTFIFYDTLGTLLWLLIIIPLGWLAGQGAHNFIPIYRNVSYIIFILIISFLMFKIIGQWIQKKIKTQTKL